MVMPVRPFLLRPPTSRSTHLPRPRTVRMSPWATIRSPFRQSRWFTCTRPPRFSSAARVRLMEKPLEAPPAKVPAKPAKAAKGSKSTRTQTGKKTSGKSARRASKNK